MRKEIGVLALALAGWNFAAPAHADCTIGKFAELPVVMDSLRPMVDVGINGKPQRMLADSGAFYSIITPGSAAALNLKTVDGPRGFYMVGVNGTAKVRVATVADFNLAGVGLRNIEFIVGGSEVGSLGVIGQNVLGIADAEYDLPHGAIRLMKPQACEKAGLAYWAANRPVSVLDIARNRIGDAHIVGTVVLNGKNVRAVFDTGAPTTIVSLDTAARLGIRPDSPGVKPAGVSTGFGSGVIGVWSAPFASFKIDQEEIRNVHILIGAMTGGTDMLIGADFFIAHRVYVSNAQHRLYLTYEGGPVFNTSTRREDASGAEDKSQLPAADNPQTADAFSRRGAVRLAQKDNKSAIADFAQAIARAPAEPRYLIQRAGAYIAADQTRLAETDLDAAIKLRSDDLDARMMRAVLRLRDDRRAAAVEDVEAAAHAAPVAADERLEMAGILSEADEQVRAVDQYDLWITAHPIDARLPEALNGRCWARALAGIDLKAALTDCNDALAQRPGWLSFLDSRGLVRLRMGDTAKAIQDYNAVLAKSPRTAWSLYGRGIAKLRKGDAEGSKADLAAAAAISPKLADRAKKFGIVP